MILSKARPAAGWESICDNIKQIKLLGVKTALKLENNFKHRQEIGMDNFQRKTGKHPSGRQKPNRSIIDSPHSR